MLPPNLITNRRTPTPAELLARAKAAEQSAPKPASRRRELQHDLGDAFAALWDRLGDGTPYVREYRFDADRQWRFDVAFLAQRVAIELEGGVWTAGRHTRSTGFKADCEKYTAAAVAGWRILRFIGDDLAKSPLQVVESVKAALNFQE